MNSQPSHIFGVIGWPIAHSRSPRMHNAALRATGIDGYYLAFGVEPSQLMVAVSGMRALGVDGFNITVPHKESMLGLVDEVEPDALTIGAINTVYRDGSRWIGANTDAPGLAQALHAAQVPLQGAQVTVLGAGGAARAAVVGLARAGASRVQIVARRLERAVDMVQALETACPTTELVAVGMGQGLRGALRHTSLLVQATSATLVQEAADATSAEAFADQLPLDALPDHAVITDMVYKPLVTAVMQRGTARGLRTVDGLGMLLHQGALAFERWTGRAAPVDVMRAALEGP